MLRTAPEEEILSAPIRTICRSELSVVNDEHARAGDVSGKRVIFCSLLLEKNGDRRRDEASETPSKRGRDSRMWRLTVSSDDGMEEMRTWEIVEDSERVRIDKDDGDSEEGRTVVERKDWKAVEIEAIEDSLREARMPFSVERICVVGIED